jgi:hypothetical protein
VHTITGAPTALSAGNTFTLTLTQQVGQSNYAGVEFYSDAACATKVTPTGGTLTPSVRPVTLPSTDVTLTDQVIDLSVANEQIDWAGPAVSLTITGLSSVTGGGALYFRVRVSTNE